MVFDQLLEDIREYGKPFVIMVGGLLVLMILVSAIALQLEFSLEVIILGFIGLVFLGILGASIKIFA